VEPETISPFCHSSSFVRAIRKQVLAEALNIPLIAFTTQYAYNILQRLDFEVEVSGG